MAKRPPPKKKEYRWRIVRLRATPAAYVGTVMAPDAESALRKRLPSTKLLTQSIRRS
jgi:hypothetical protein